MLLTIQKSFQFLKCGLQDNLVQKIALIIKLIGPLWKNNFKRIIFILKINCFFL